ncbi:MAG: 3-oxoacyl-ACP reductase FabG [Desulfobacterales bacterium]|jgi:3-oxoacyl-[acyl-carrier protein] reductase|nr:3-oxoacyl-ACP reductase FabG [Desulfobacteraceae bacterium]MBT4362861.1 3-oxoacyl-ACP reductase FabG [Desulfobacteraceae bacterium]MBT7085013.1 3-oxoacyl-ACP reductase FabG [Desulfobacterales bacterium]
MLKGKVAIVTGSGNGVGKGIALRLSQKGADIVVNDIDGAAANEVAKMIKEQGGNAIAVKADVSKKSEVEILVQTTVTEFGRLDILVNNAGECKAALLEDMTEEDWDRVIDVDLKGTFLCTQAAVPHMRKGKYGRVINISSPDALIGETGMVNFISAKAGVLGLTISVAKEFSRYINEEGCVMTCNAVLVGYSPTNMTEELFPEHARDHFADVVPLGRPADPEKDVGSTVAFLASEKASYITGAKIPVTGGLFACISSY